MRKKMTIILSIAILFILIGAFLTIFKKGEVKPNQPNDNPPVEEKKGLTKEQALALLNEKVPLENGIYQFVEEVENKYYRFEIVSEDGSVREELTYLVDKLEHLLYKENSYVQEDADFE